MMLLVTSSMRSFALACLTLILHALGDVPSPPIIGMLAGSLAVTTSEVKSTGPMEMKKWCKGVRIDDDTDCDDIDEGGDYSFSYSGPGVLCPGYDKDAFCACDGDRTENPKWCSCPKALDCCS